MQQSDSIDSSIIAIDIGGSKTRIAYRWLRPTRPAHNPNNLAYFLYAANCLLCKLVAIASQNLVEKTRFCSIIAYYDADGLKPFYHAPTPQDPEDFLRQVTAAIERAAIPTLLGE